jgi:hypothetical protein
MQIYTDMTGAEHRVAITMQHRFQIKAKTGMDLLAAAGSPDRILELLEKISNDDFFVISCLAIIEGQTEEALMSVADGSVMENASTAFVEALLDFYPPSNPMVKPLRTFIDRSTKQVQEVFSAIEAGMDQIAQTMDLLTVGSPSPILTNGSGESSASSDTAPQTLLNSPSDS